MQVKSLLFPPLSLTDSSGLALTVDRHVKKSNIEITNIGDLKDDPFDVILLIVNKENIAKTIKDLKKEICIIKRIN